MVPCLFGADVSKLFSGERVLVTGAGGFVGRHLCRRLVDLQANVVAADCCSPEVAESLPGFIQVDISEFDDVRVLGGVEPTLVFHLAAAGASDPYLDVAAALRVNVLGTVNLLHVLSGSALVVVARTAAERKASSPYAASKAASWKFCRMYARSNGWPVRGATLFQCYGAGQSENNVIPAVLSAARLGRRFPLSPGEQVRDWVSVEDVVSGLLAVAQSDLAAAESIEIGTGKGTSLSDTVQMIFDLGGGDGSPLFGALPYRRGEDMYTVADSELTERRTGWRAKIGLMEGLSALVRTGA